MRKDEMKDTLLSVRRDITDVQETVDSIASDVDDIDSAMDSLPQFIANHITTAYKQQAQMIEDVLECHIARHATSLLMDFPVNCEAMDILRAVNKWSDGREILKIELALTDGTKNIFVVTVRNGDRNDTKPAPEVVCEARSEYIALDRNQSQLRLGDIVQDRHGNTLNAYKIVGFNRLLDLLYVEGLTDGDPTQALACGESVLWKSV